jgi:hypothetical protein
MFSFSSASCFFASDSKTLFLASLVKVGIPSQAPPSFLSFSLSLTKSTDHFCS